MSEFVLTSVLSSVERSRLAKLEAIVEGGLQTFVKVGEALREIRDGRLYRDTHQTFEAYCRERWGMERAHAYRQIEAAWIAEVLSPTGDIPANERQARVLAPLLRQDEQQAVEVWRGLQAKYGSKLTAEKVEQAVREKLVFEQKVGSLKSSKSVEWYTPATYIAAAREVLGDIDLDPASSAEANRVVGAKTFYDVVRDGLAQPWRGCVWMNPPYGKQSAGFVSRLLDEYAAGNVKAAIVLLNAYSTDVKWFQPLWDYLLCFTDHRINFHSPVYEGSNNTTTGSVFVYVGSDQLRFARVFQRFGAVVEKSALLERAV